MRVMAGARNAAPADGPKLCPVWQYVPPAQPITDVYPCRDDHDAPATCDHFGSPQYLDDPATPAFEGMPRECGQQRDQFGPIAGFMTIAHGKGKIRGCVPGSAV